VPKPFQGVVNVDIRDSVPDWAPFEAPRPPEGAPNVMYMAPWVFTGGTIKRVAVDVSGEPYVDLEREAVAMMSRE